MSTAVTLGSRAGLTGVSLGWSVAAVTILMVVLFRAAQVTGISSLGILGQLLRTAIPAASMVFCVIAIDHILDIEGFIRLTILVLTGFAFYTIALWSVRRSEVLELIRLFRADKAKT